jgi:ribonucleoside-diphosphate reductase alpha chain
LADLQTRVARALAQAEGPDRSVDWEGVFARALQAGFIPGGRINAQAGALGHGMLINCFVQPAQIAGETTPVSRAIELALATLALGGGVGYDFSPLSTQPGQPSGPLEAMRALDRACEKLFENQCRRCAQMAVLRCDHPEVLDFIRAKHQGGLKNFNTSVAITDAFMQAVCSDAPQARAIWAEITHAAFHHGEPGVLFIDRLNQENTLGWCETLCATNPCGEQPLPEFGACDLGSINLTRFVEAPFTARARFNFAAFSTLIPVAVRMLDNVLDLTRWPLPQHAQESLAKRRIGLGFTGLADTLIMLGLHYGSPAARRLVAKICKRLRDTAFMASVRLARERGPFPAFEAGPYLAEQGFAARLPAGLRQAIRRHGIRNGHLLAIAPAGSISLAFADNVANGIEPVFAWRQARVVRMAGGGTHTFEAENFAWRLYRHLGGNPSTLPSAFVTAPELDGAAHLEMVAAAAPFIDAGISKTVNLPPEARCESADTLFKMAWRLGLKGVTCFPARAALGAPLSAIKVGTASRGVGAFPSDTLGAAKPEYPFIRRPL